MNKIKIIDLLNMMSKGEEVPKKIKCRDIIFVFDDEYESYYREDEDSEEFYTFEMITGFVNLNDEVEIMEDVPKKIEKTNKICNRL